MWCDNMIPETEYVTHFKNVKEITNIINILGNVARCWKYGGVSIIRIYGKFPMVMTVMGLTIRIMGGSRWLQI